MKGRDIMRFRRRRRGRAGGRRRSFGRRRRRTFRPTRGMRIGWRM